MTGSLPTRKERTSLGDLLALQRKHDLGGVHLVNVRATTFDLAHTDGERAAQFDLEDCPVHRWLVGLSGPPARPGRYQVLNHEPDPDSEPYGAEPYDLEPLEL